MLYRTTLAKANPKLYIIKIATPGRNIMSINIAI